MVTWLDGSSPGVFHFNWLLPSLPDRPDGYARPQRREHPPLQQCSLVPAAPVCPGALPQWRPVQPPAGHLWMRLPEWVLRRTLSEQWVTHLSQFGHFNTVNTSRWLSRLSGLSLIGSTLKRHMAAFIWLHFRLRVSGTEIRNILCNTTCSWLASIKMPWKQTCHGSFMFFLCQFQPEATGMKIIQCVFRMLMTFSKRLHSSCITCPWLRTDSPSERCLSVFTINLVRTGSSTISR